MKYKVLLIFLFSFLSSAKNQKNYFYPIEENISDNRNLYFRDLLSRVMEVTNDKFGQASVKPSTNKIVQSRALKNLATNHGVDIMWTMTSIDREEVALPIRIPLLKGLLGHRIFIIRQGDQKIFDKVSTLDELKQIPLGQGEDWPDTKILRVNGFNVVTSSSYSSLFDMLVKNRFDYFPRGVNEPWEEIKKKKELKLEIEKRFLIYYPSPIYFFVNKSNTSLAKRIEEGLEILIKSGEFERNLKGHELTKDIFEKSAIDKRIIFKVSNPLLPPLTPLKRKEFWY